ncbi:MAG: Asp-tRNA(Asn)/Glu-tRNA(Gln) amidotransferase subunit GatC [Spirochaetia bacterium]|nr:Asp-tRNA(Asn)/Glu-tRNA(Gln) amidotransferase subunit GatC [Spirochaetia bacterium]
MAISKSDDVYAAKLARIEVAEDQIDRLAKDRAGIVAFVEKINEVDTSKVEPLLSVQDLSNVMREDVPGPVLPVATVEKLAPRFESGHIVVPAVIE